MPELPEVQTIRRGLERTVLGKTIKKVEVRLPKIISLGPKTVSNVRKSSSNIAAKFRTLLQGQRIVKVDRRAKMLLLDLNGPLTILIHLKMTGQLIFAKKGERKKIKIMNTENARILELPHQYTHLIFEFTDGSKLYYNDLRQFGYVRLVRDEDLLQVRELNEYGPEPFTTDFTIAHLAVKAKKRPNLTIKQFLTDPKIVAGIGNIYSDEILYCAKIKPVRKVKEIKNSEWKLLYICIPKILREAIKYQGSSVGDFLKADGSEGEYGKIHRVYQRAGEKCKTCGTVIKSVKIGGRTSSYCPKCQK